jgi:hypothetical protein
MGPGAAWWRNPYTLALLGLALLLAGWKVSAELAFGGEQAALFRVGGRLAFLLGLLLFVSAAVLMYRHPEAEPPPDEGADEAPPD